MGKTSRRAIAGRTRKHILAGAVALSFVSTAVANAEDSFKIGVVTEVVGEIRTGS